MPKIVDWDAKRDEILSATWRVIALEALPLDEQRDLEAQIEISFWGRALGTPRLRDLQHSEFDSLCSRLRGHLEEAGRLGELAGDLDLDFATHQLVVLIDGLSAERVLYPDRVAPERQVRMLDRLLGSFRPVVSG